QPLAFAPWNQHELIAGFQFVMATTDGGMHWTKLSPDLGYPKDVTPPPDSLRGRGAPGAVIGGAIQSLAPSAVRRGVIWAGTKKPGLLSAGTESGVYVSFDDGDHWQSLQLNLPNTSYRDMVVHDNDLVVGTYGRGIWVLDDFSPLRQLTPALASAPVHLFAPGDAVRVRRNVGADTPFPPEVPHALNPPDGALIYYYLAAKPAGDISLDVQD